MLMAAGAVTVKKREGTGGIGQNPGPSRPELLRSMTGIKLTHVPYKGLAPALNDVVASSWQMVAAPAGSQ
jgi:tripartite-type tricarboxylate transporter receptor subunit TctC